MDYVHSLVIRFVPSEKDMAKELDQCNTKNWKRMWVEYL